MKNTVKTKAQGRKTAAMGGRDEAVKRGSAFERENAIERGSAFERENAIERGSALRRLVRTVGDEAKANFAAWYERNFKNARAGLIGKTSYVRAGALDDRPGDGVWYADAYARATLDYVEPLSTEEARYVFSHPLIALQLATGVTDLRGLRCLRRGLTARVNALQHKSYRARYYARDNARRRLLAAERRKIRRRTTTNPCPTADEFRAAFARIRESVEAKIRFGGMVHDLECYVDNCLRIDARGEIVGRNGGVKAWLFDHVPELYPRYKTIMRYKALAKRVRQLADISDPVPTDALFDEHPAPAATPHAAGATSSVRTTNTAEKKRENEIFVHENYYAIKSQSRRTKGHGVADSELQRAWKKLMAAREKARKALMSCENTFSALFQRVNEELPSLSNGK